MRNVHRKVVAVRQNLLFTYDRANYEDFINFLKLYTLQKRRIYLDAPFLISYYPSLKCCPSLLDSSGARNVLGNFWNSTVFIAICKKKKNLRPSVAFRMLTICAKSSVSSGN
jgi:hypothetical protein